jgi:hypothetical protein
VCDPNGSGTADDFLNGDARAGTCRKVELECDIWRVRGGFAVSIGVNSGAFANDTGAGAGVE